MAIDRTFRDVDGIEWRVSYVPPDETSSPTSDGWLSFEAGWMHRRISPAPSNWEHAPIHRLEQMCRVANPVKRDEEAIEKREAAAQNAAVPPADAAGETVNQTPIEAPAIPPATHVSLLANAWPARGGRVSFRG